MESTFQKSVNNLSSPLDARPLRDVYLSKYPTHQFVASWSTDVFADAIYYCDSKDTRSRKRRGNVYIIVRADGVPVIYKSKKPRCGSCGKRVPASLARSGRVCEKCGGGNNEPVGDKAGLPWGTDGKWLNKRPPIVIDRTNSNYLYIEADGSKYHIECVTVDKELYFRAVDVCRMLGVDLAHDQPKSSHIRQKLLLDADIGILRIINTTCVHRNRDVICSGNGHVQTILFFTLDGLLTYLRRTPGEVRSLVMVGSGSIVHTVLSKTHSMTLRPKRKQNPNKGGLYVLRMRSDSHVIKVGCSCTCLKTRVAHYKGFIEPQETLLLLSMEGESKQVVHAAEVSLISFVDSLSYTDRMGGTREWYRVTDMCKLRADLAAFEKGLFD